MEWEARMNAVIDYIEAHLCDEVSPEVISQISACPFSVFQRAFAQIAGIPLSEYVRRRKLSCAVSEIRETDRKIIEIGLKYGYESADAFSAAMRRLHGVSPSRIRGCGTKLKYFPRMRFALTIEGVNEMDYNMVKRDAFSVCGIRRSTASAGGTWGLVKADGSLERMQKTVGEGFISLGMCFGYDQEGNNDYMCGFECSTTDIPDYDHFLFPASDWLVFRAEGSIKDGALGGMWKRIYGEFMPQSVYRQRDLPTIERYLVWDEERDRCTVEIMIPVEH